MGRTPLPQPTRSTLRDRLRLTHQLLRAHPTGRITLKVAVAIIGGLVVGIGIVLIPLPGPGWLIVFAGLGIWAIEFVWARHLLKFGRHKLHIWTEWVKRQSLPVRLLIGLIGLVFVGAIAAFTVKHSFGIDIVDDVWQFLISD